jgi:predicted ATPase
VSPTRTLGTRAGRGARSRPASEAPGITSFNSTIATYRLSGTTAWTPFWLSFLARAYAEVSDFGEARRCSAEAIAAVATTKERIFEAEVYRVGGGIALKEPQPDTMKAQSCFERALSVARQQQAKSRELRAAMSLARLWRDQGKVQEARELLAPVYGWFTEGFDTCDLRDAKALLDEFAA